MNTIRTARLGLLAALCACSFAAAAQSVEPAPEPLQDPAQVPATELQEPPAVAAINPGDEPANEPFCLRETGTHIKLRDEPRTDGEQPRCVAAPGSVYTREDLQRTGAMDVKDALRRLSPIVH